jgi:hypothetical protein
VTEDDEPIYVDQMGTEWWWDGRIWNYWKDDREWAQAPGATPISLIEYEDTVPLGARPPPPGYWRASDGWLYMR